GVFWVAQGGAGWREGAAAEGRWAGEGAGGAGLVEGGSGLKFDVCGQVERGWLKPSMRWRASMLLSSEMNILLRAASRRRAILSWWRGLSNWRRSAREFWARKTLRERVSWEIWMVFLRLVSGSVSL